ncbi:actin-histidine N-methyltransferase isoform X2 [Phymastichus coffea]|nr:actin-histidine N-methyltransferase isoform X2 [Phymastichus coffea]
MEILDQINSLENINSDVAERDEYIEEFINWMKKNGAKIDGVRIDYFPSYELGLRANIDLNEGEVILEIPRALIFNVYSAASELNNLKSDTILQNMPQIALAIALLIEKRKDFSIWKSYLNILPRKYNTILYMNKEEMFLLKGSPSFEKSLKHCRSIVRQYAYFYRLFQNDNGLVGSLLKNYFTYEQYRWAVSTVMTRQNLIPDKNGSEMVYSLIPMWDMCNHQEGRITTDFDLESNHCKCYAMKKFRKDDQIFIYYGSRSNLEFFLYSGFIYFENKNDNFPIRLGLSKSDALYTKKATLLSKMGIPVNGEYILHPGSNPLSDLLIKYLKIFCMDQNEIDHYLSDESLSGLTDIEFISEKKIDKRILDFLITRLKLLAMKYVIKTENTQKIEADTRPCKTVAVQLRMSEEKIIQRLILDLQNLNDASIYH